MEYFETLGPRFIAGGDYNAKHPRWGSRLTTTRGRELHKATTQPLRTFVSGSTYLLAHRQKQNS